MEIEMPGKILVAEVINPPPLIYGDKNPLFCYRDPSRIAFTNMQ